MDTVSEASTQAICVKAISLTPNDGTPGRVGLVLYPDEAAKALRDDVKVKSKRLFLFPKGRPIMNLNSVFRYCDIHGP